MGAEISFLAVLLRLMTLLVPSLHQIHAERPGSASRFSCMATMIMESLGSHPVVAVECMAFFEVLSDNNNLLPGISPNMNRTDSPIYSCIPYCIKSLKPRYPDLFVVPNWSEMKGCLPSTRGLRSVLRAVKIFSRVGIMDYDDVEVASSVIAFLEATCASRFFAGSTLHRPLAAPRSAELIAVEGLAVEKEGTEVLRNLLVAKRPLPHYCGGLLRWILFAQSLLAKSSSDSSEKEESEETPRSVEGVICEANAVAAGDAARVFAHIGAIRWQIRSLVTIIATEAISEMLGSDGTARTDSPNFDYTSAKEDIQRALATNDIKPSSRLVLHLGSILSLACTSAVAAIDQVELPMLQLSGVLLLSNLVACFRGIKDSEQQDAFILDQYATQILASVKHSLGDPEELSGEAYFARFFGGCQAIQTIADSELAKDPIALKRIIRPTIPSAEEASFFEFNVAHPILAHTSIDGTFDNRRSILLLHLGKVWTAGKLLMSRNIDESKLNTIKKLVEDEAGLAVHSAVIAFDGTRLLLGAGATLCGGGKLASNDKKATEGQRGFLYNNIQDIDDATKATMVKIWSSCGCFALRSLFSLISSNSNPPNQESCLVWLKHLAPLMLAGLNDSLSSFESKEPREGPGWCQNIESSEVAVDCLHSLVVLVENSTGNKIMEELGVDMDRILGRLRESVILPALGQNSKDDETFEGFLLLPERRRADVIREVCDLIQYLARTKAIASSALLMSILKPLDLLQRGVISLDQKHAESVISTCLVAASSLVSSSNREDSFVKSMVKVALDLKKSDELVPDTVYKAARSLLQGCLTHGSMTSKDRRHIAHDLAKIGDWESWRLVCTIDSGLAVFGSMDIIKNVLLDTSKPEKQLEALNALRQLVQAPDCVLVDRIINEVGAEVLHFFKMFGTLAPGMTLSRAEKARRTTACADTMKVVLVTIQHLVSASTEEPMFVGFLMVLFEYLIMVLRFNGLPGTPPPKTESDPALGRMCAQAIVHIARTAPAPFKTTLAGLPDPNGRALIEFAVRAEMTGYTNTNIQAPAKKKIDLKGFAK